MNEEQHKELVTNIAALRNVVGQLTAHSLVGYTWSKIRQFAIELDNTQPIGLISPARQTFYLLGLMCTTDAPESPLRLDAELTQSVEELLNAIFNSYAWMFWPSDEDDEINDEWRRCRDVALPAFLHYFNTGLLASIEQIEERIRTYIGPFDDVIQTAHGLSIEQVLSIAWTITNTMQNKMKQVMELAPGVNQARSELMKAAAEQGLNVEQVRAKATESGHDKTVAELLEAIDNVFTLERADLLEEHSDDLITPFLDTFAIERSSGREFVYMTEKNPAEFAPIFEEVGRYYCPSPNALFNAALWRLEETVEASEHRDGYFQNRDSVLEDQTAETFGALLADSNPTVLKEVFETEDKQFEHDVVIQSGETVLFIECKASPPLEPFRDPERAFQRLSRHFRSDRGIQHAFDQANRLRSRLRTDGSLTLYGISGEVVFDVSMGENTNVYCICVTRDDYGPLATNLNLLLEKPENAEYPWVVNEFDLHTLVMAVRHLKLDHRTFLGFLEERIKQHGRLIGTDELEYVGYYLTHGNFDQIAAAKADLVYLSPDYSNVFDEIYQAEITGGKVQLEKATAPYPIESTNSSSKQKAKKNKQPINRSGMSKKHMRKLKNRAKNRR